MLERVIERMEAFGYTIQDGDEVILSFCVEKVRSTIKNECNVQDIPEGLMHIAVDMVIGEFLMAKKTFAPDHLSWLDLGYAITQLSEGDRSTSFAVGDSSLTDEQRLDNFISHLLTYGQNQLASFRRIRW